MKRVSHVQRLCRPRQVILISYKLHPATSMSTIKRDYAAVILENLLPISVVIYSGVPRTSPADCRQEVDRHEATRIVDRIVA